MIFGKVGNPMYN